MTHYRSYVSRSPRISLPFSGIVPHTAVSYLCHLRDVARYWSAPELFFEFHVVDIQEALPYRTDRKLNAGGGPYQRVDLAYHTECLIMERHGTKQG